MNPFFTRKELAEILNVSVRHIDRLNAAGKLPPPKYICNSVRWDPKDIDDWLDNNWKNGKKR